MIVCNLRVLLAKKGLKIAKVSRDTKISRTTLTALCSNTSTPKGIQFETINTLCTYLDVQPGELFEFYPIKITDVEIEQEAQKETEHMDVEKIEQLTEKAADKLMKLIDKNEFTETDVKAMNTLGSFVLNVLSVYQMNLRKTRGIRNVDNDSDNV